VHLLGDDQMSDPFPPQAREEDEADRAAADRAIAFSAIGLAITGVAELVISVLGGSVGLLGDALHNLSDVSTSAMVFVGFRVSRRQATPTHPYGYERAEDIAGLGVALVIWGSAAFAGYISWRKLAGHGTTSHVGIGMAAAVVGIIGNQVVARYKRRVGVRIHSATLISDAQHSWLDALSSLGALLGLVGVALGWRWADPVAGLVVTAFIAHVGWEVTAGIIGHLMDGVDKATVTAAEQAASAIAGVHHAHVRARWLGRSLLVEVEGFVDAGRTVADAEQTGRAVEEAVLAVVPETSAVLWTPRAMPRG
jgi:cation diffusion facilitator family transporter